MAQTESGGGIYAGGRSESPVARITARLLGKRRLWRAESRNSTGTGLGRRKLESTLRRRRGCRRKLERLVCIQARRCRKAWRRRCKTLSRVLSRCNGQRWRRKRRNESKARPPAQLRRRMHSLCLGLCYRSPGLRNAQRMPPGMPHSRRKLWGLE